jgi:hypothetical protein
MPSNSSMSSGSRILRTSSMPSGSPMLSSSSTSSSSPTPGNGSMTSGSPTVGSSSKAIQTKAIIGGVIGATVMALLGAIVFCILRRKRRYGATLSASAQMFTSFGLPGQRVLPLVPSHATTQPFLVFPATQDLSTSKGIIAEYTSGILAQKNRGDIEQAVNSFRDPGSTRGGLSGNDNESQQVTITLARFEGDFRQLCMLAQSGQLSAEDQIRLEGIRHFMFTRLMMPCSLGHNRYPVPRYSSSGSSLCPPSYCTRGG